jgi:transposase-like protein
MGDRFDHTLEHTLKTKPDEADDGADDAVTTVRRIELITGPGPHSGRRRQWSDDDKVRIIIESLMPGANVSEVARRNGLSPQQLFGWRREARALMTEQADDAAGVWAGCPRSGTRQERPIEAVRRRELVCRARARVRAGRRRNLRCSSAGTTVAAHALRPTDVRQHRDRAS